MALYLLHYPVEQTWLDLVLLDVEDKLQKNLYFYVCVVYRFDLDRNSSTKYQ